MSSILLQMLMWLWREVNVTSKFCFERFALSTKETFLFQSFMSVLPRGTWLRATRSRSTWSHSAWPRSTLKGQNNLKHLLKFYLTTTLVLFQQEIDQKLLSSKTLQAIRQTPEPALFFVPGSPSGSPAHPVWCKVCPISLARTRPSPPSHIPN